MQNTSNLHHCKFEVHKHHELEKQRIWAPMMNSKNPVKVYRYKNFTLANHTAALTSLLLTYALLISLKYFTNQYVKFVSSFNSKLLNPKY